MLDAVCAFLDFLCSPIPLVYLILSCMLLWLRPSFPPVCMIPLSIFGSSGLGSWSALVCDYIKTMSVNFDKILLYTLIFLDGYLSGAYSARGIRLQKSSTHTGAHCPVFQAVNITVSTGTAGLPWGILFVSLFSSDAWLTFQMSLLLHPLGKWGGWKCVDCLLGFKEIDLTVQVHKIIRYLELLYLWSHMNKS